MVPKQFESPDSLVSEQRAGWGYVFTRGEQEAIACSWGKELGGLLCTLKSPLWLTELCLVHDSCGVILDPLP